MSPELIDEGTEHDEQLVRLLIPHWYATRAWAEELLRRSLDLERPEDVLGRGHRGWHVIPGSNWHYRTHGVGVDLDRGVSSGGIDFDFPQKAPDPYRLHVFAQKQLNAGNLSLAYTRLVDDEERFAKAAKKVLDPTPAG